MLKKLLTISLMLFFASSFMLAQSTHMLNASGKLQKLKDGKNSREAITSTKLQSLSGQAIEKSVFLESKFNVQGTIDTLAYSDQGTFNTNFGFNGQDVMMQYFQAPADLVINAAGFTVSDDEGFANVTISVRLIKLNWTYEQLAAVDAPMNMGAYPSDDGVGLIEPFGEDDQSTWIDSTDGEYSLPPWTDNANPGENTFDYDIWSDGGYGWPVSSAPASESNARVYHWVEMTNLPGPDTVKQGEVFAVVLIHDGDGVDPLADRIGFWSSDGVGVPGWKYYEAGRNNPQDGWWARAYTWDFVVAVELTGDRAPKITNLTRLNTTVETTPQTVSATIVDDNPSGGAEGVGQADLMYSVDAGVTYNTVAMTASGDVFSADIPGQQPGTNITYKVVASDVEGLTTTSGNSSYKIFETVNEDLLVVFNGGSEGRALLLAPYYLNGTVENYDVWAGYGPIGDFINFYKAVVVIHAEGGPADDNQAAIAGYAAQGNVNLAVIGQEVLGHLNNFTDSTFEAGTFEYDVLGVMTSYNDVNYDADAGNQADPSQAIPVAGTVLGGPVADFLTANALDTLWYDPNGVLGSDNWMDQFDARQDIGSEVFMNSVALDGTERSAGHNFASGNGNNVLFMSLDPLVLDSDSGWVGASALSPLVKWLSDNVTSVKKTDNSVPSEFRVEQNYPNPFNPSTVINYSLTASSKVSLAIYDVLGRKVVDLVNQTQNSGSYQATWNGLNKVGQKVNSGVYFYTLTAGDFVQTKKMMLLK